MQDQVKQRLGVEIVKTSQEILGASTFSRKGKKKSFQPDKGSSGKKNCGVEK